MGSTAITNVDRIATLVEKQKKQIQLALPKHVSVDRMVRVAMTECRKNPKLMECDPVSFLGGVIQASQLGLEIGGTLGQCYLVPFTNRRKGITEAQFIVGYRGMIDLARRSGQIVSISARTVHENDEFDFCYGLEENISHRPATFGRGDMTHVYAVAKLKDGGVQFEVMSKEEIENVRNGSQGYKYAASRGMTDNPWIENFEEMAKKTVIRRLFKYLPVSIELQQAIVTDEYGDAGLQESPIYLEAEEQKALPTGKTSLKRKPLPSPLDNQHQPEPAVEPLAEGELTQEAAATADMLDDLKQRIDEATDKAALLAIQKEYAGLGLEMDVVDELDKMCNEKAKEF